MSNKSSTAKNQSGSDLDKSQSSSKRKSLDDKKKFYRYSDFDEKDMLASEEEDDDKKRKGQKEWDEEYREYDEDDLGTDFGKP